MSPRLQTTLLFLLCAWVWGSTWLGIRLGLEGVPPMVAAALRMSSSGIILVLVALALHEQWPRTKIYPVHIAVQGSLLFCFQYALIYWAEQTVPSGLAAALFATLPIVTAVNASLIFHMERISVTQVFGLLLGLAGVGTIFWAEVIHASLAPPLGIAALLLAVVGASFATVFAKRYAHGISPLATVGPGQLLGGALLAVLALIVDRGKPIHFTPTSAGALVYLIAATCIVFLAYFTLLKRMPVTTLSLLTYVTPVIAVILGALVAHEAFPLTTGLGVGVVLAGVYLVGRR